MNHYYQHSNRSVWFKRFDRDCSISSFRLNNICLKQHIFNWHICSGSASHNFKPTKQLKGLDLITHLAGNAKPRICIFCGFLESHMKTSNSMIKKQWCSCHSCLLYIRIIFCELHSHVRRKGHQYLWPNGSVLPELWDFHSSLNRPMVGKRQGRTVSSEHKVFRSFHIRMQNGKCIHSTACEKKQYIYIVHLYIFINEFQHKYVGPSSLFFSVRKRSVSNWKLFALGILIHKRHVHLDTVNNFICKYKHIYIYLHIYINHILYISMIYLCWKIVTSKPNR